MTGTIRKLNDRGFGFINGDGRVSYFFHATGLGKGLTFEDLHEGDNVTFDVVPSAKGLRAEDVRLAR